MHLSAQLVNGPLGSPRTECHSHRITGDHAEHHIADRARDMPTRTAVGVAGITLFGVAWAAGGDDAIARFFRFDLFDLVWFFRIALVAGPLLAFFVTRRLCLGLQRMDRELVHEGVETGVIERSPTGSYYELLTPPSPEDRAKIPDMYNGGPKRRELARQGPGGGRRERRR